ncbi:MAG: GtrA family protein [Defluviitaleaceae bacterium]|nr:GtrA family protein [Defluviitaleaceae bacterium]
MKKILELLTRILLFFTPGKLKGFVKYETVSYLFFGGLTTLLSIGLFWVFHYVIGHQVVIAGTISDVLAIIFAYFTNKIYVFESPSWKPRILVPEMIKFGTSRILTVVLGNLALVLLVDVLDFNAMLMRIITIVIIHVIGNYILSKWIVFVKKGDTNDS